MIVKEETVFTIRKVEGKMRKSENGKLTQIICNACGRELKVEKEIIRERDISPQMSVLDILAGKTVCETCL